jgi:3-hydroxybutyryl-CoA dehydrogenase
MNNSPAGVIGVVGAGTMGEGIAQVALQSGYSVVLFDIQADVLQRAVSDIHKKINRLVDKGKLPREAADGAVARLAASQDIAHLAQAQLVIEAVPERLNIKRDIFRQLEQVCSKDTILATNTSSLSVTVIGAGCQYPGRVVGMHFFNPAPVMKLVEVVVGDDTTSEVVDAVVRLARSFGKHPIVCKDTPGFIVNRVARNFYGEALRIVGEGTADPADVDWLMENGAGFRMGPFALMDLIGIDVNLDVTKAVYHAYHEEPRFRPHALQERMVAAGRLGRKTGRGFYSYDTADAAATEVPAQLDRNACAEQATTQVGNVVVIGDTPLASSLLRRVAERAGKSLANAGVAYDGALADWDTVGIQWRADEVEAFLRRCRPDIVLVSVAGEEAYHRPLLQAVERAVGEDVLILTSVAGPSATEQAGWLRRGDRVRGFHVILGDNGFVKEAHPAFEWTVPFQAQTSDAEEDERWNRRTEALALSLGCVPRQVRDGAGGVVMRILAMLFNEAAEVMREGVATAEDIDTGMKLGTNYPRGPVEWMDDLGIPVVWNTLCALSREFGDDRYRPSPLLRQMVTAGRHGNREGGSVQWASLTK